MSKRISILTTLMLLLPFFVMAQEEFVDPPSRELTKISFTQFIGGVVVIKARLDNHEDSLRFILDSGSGGISLDSATASELGLKPTTPDRLIRGIGGVRKVGFLNNHKLKIGGLTIDSLNFHVVDYELLSSLYGEKIDGIIGYSVFRRYIVKINYDVNEVSFWSNGTIRYPSGGFLMRPRVNMLPFSTALVKDDKRMAFNYLLDIGAGLTVLFSQDYVNDSAFLKTSRRKYTKQGEGLGGKINIHLTVMKELKIGPYRFRNVPVNIFEDKYNITSYPQLGGLIGNEIFRRFNCVFNYDKRLIHLVPNKHFTDLFDYGYSGIELYLIDGKVVTGEIPTGSPAAAAGFRAGDEVLAVNNRFGMTLNDLKQALQSVYGEIKVVIRRKNELSVLKLNVVNILKDKQ